MGTVSTRTATSEQTVFTYGPRGRRYAVYFGVLSAGLIISGPVLWIALESLEAGLIPFLIGLAVGAGAWWTHLAARNCRVELRGDDILFRDWRARDHLI